MMEEELFTLLCSQVHSGFQATFQADTIPSPHFYSVIVSDRLQKWKGERNHLLAQRN